MYQAPEIFELGQAEQLTLGGCDAALFDRHTQVWYICSS